MRRNILFIVAALLLVAPLPSSAQIKLELNQLTCGEWLGYSPANQDFVRFWLSGYYIAPSQKRDASLIQIKEQAVWSDLR